MDKSLKAACIGEFLGTALLIFFGVGCVAALKVAGANFGQWEISIMWGLGSQSRFTLPPVFLVHISIPPSRSRYGSLPVLTVKSRSLHLSTTCRRLLFRCFSVLFIP